jgi:hypothetical protein
MLAAVAGWAIQADQFNQWCDEWKAVNWDQWVADGIILAGAPISSKHVCAFEHRKFGRVCFA